MSKVAVVTGSAKGLGRALAITLAKEHFSVVVHYRKSEKEANEVLRLIKKDSSRSIVVKGDVTREDEVKKIFDFIFKKFARVDLLVNNVGNFIYREFNKTTFDDFKDIVESNIYSTLLCSRAVLPFMRKQKSGHIINIGAVGAENITLLEKTTPYYLSKNVLYSLTKITAWEEAPNGIHVNMISPASLSTDIFKAGDFPMGRSANYSDVVKVLLFLISPQAYYINGSNIEVAGAFIPGLS